jgi:hypothetical protein
LSKTFQNKTVARCVQPPEIAQAHPDVRATLLVLNKSVDPI